MKIIIKILSVLTALLFISCGNSAQKKSTISELIQEKHYETIQSYPSNWNTSFTISNFELAREQVIISDKNWGHKESKYYVYGILYPTEKSNELFFTYVLEIANIEKFLSNIPNLQNMNLLVDKNSTPDLFIQYANNLGIETYKERLQLKE